MNTDNTKNTPSVTRDRSPAFPFISLQAAIERLIEFEQKFGRHSAPADKVGMAWGMKGNSSQAAQTIAAIKYFGLIDYEGNGNLRKAYITEDGRTYIRAQQNEIKQNILKRIALNPKEIAKFWAIWGADRPIDEICIDTLVLENKYNEKAAPQFLKVYDETIAFAGLHTCDKIDTENNRNLDQDVLDDENGKGRFNTKNKLRPPTKMGGELMHNERVLQDGILSKNATYRIIVSGEIGPKEIERLIKKLELDKEILSDNSQNEAEKIEL